MHVTFSQTASGTAQPRPLRWEDDFSLHALDDTPFENRPPISDLTPDTSRHVGGGTTPLDAEPADIWDRIKRDRWPIPAGTNREGYVPDNDEYFWLSGLRDYLTACRLYDQHGTAPLDRMLEMGAATGRVLRHFAIQGDLSEVWGTDINHRSVRWLAENMPPNVLPVATPALAALPAQDNYFDLICAWSVFTHIDTFETAHLAELRRILRPGGIAILTAHTEHTWDRLDEGPGGGGRLVELVRAVEPEADFATPLREGRSVYRYTQKGPYRGSVFHSTSHIHQVWGRFFEVVEVLPKAHAAQTVVVLRKPA